MDIKLEKPRREPSVGDVYLYDAKHYMVIMDQDGQEEAEYYYCLDLETMRLEYTNQWMGYLMPVRGGEYVGTLKITT